MIPNLATDAATMSPLALFLQADIVVKCVMVGLLCASVWTWGIIIGHGLRLKAIAAKSTKFEKDFWASEDIDSFYTKHRASTLPSAKVLDAGVTEWRRSTAGKRIDRDGTRARLATTMGAAAAAEVDRLSDRLNILATIGSVAPFVGLFGTV
ncbi:MAG TPA: MotA/TolQ/ExbB proton channel family protein, partial [Sphingomonas sp.]|nr:MotA/TolQ/ExbB proton channel family protein [Sphingomonas sp.]